MEDLTKQITELIAAVKKALEKVSLEALRTESATLQAHMEAPGFWDDSMAAQAVSRRHAQAVQKITYWETIQSQLQDLQELAELKDDSLTTDIQTQLTTIEASFIEAKRELEFDGPYDSYDVILRILAGAGGTDAQDWAQMLLRMYVRWAEAHAIKATILEESPGEEAGIKSVTLELSGGSFLYGKLRGEHGVHRLVRLSPFNADALRQTSFARVEVMPKITAPSEVEIDDKDLKIDVYRSGGKGGQGVNTTDSAVRITHLPTNIVVAIQNERSQLQNKETAMTILRTKLAALQQEQHKEKASELRGPNEQAAWGNQIRNYVLHPYKLVKDSRSGYETADTEGVLNGDIDGLIAAYLESAK